jgi:hypothetical protein
MTVLDRLEDWKTSGLLPPAQYSVIASIVRKDRFSLFVELNALLYFGVVLCVAGIGWTIGKYFQNLGDAAILVSLTLLCGGSLYYCFSRSLPYSPQRTESPTLGFDYVLYIGALVFAVELTYIETRMELLQESWDAYLLISALLYFFLSYRFDNRFVLSLALSTLAGWFGLSFTRFGLLKADDYRTPALIYASLVAGGGLLLWRAGVKQHFLRTYLHIAANVCFVALVSGIVDSGNDPYLLALVVLSAIAIYGGLRFREFAFTAYGTVYGYIGLSIWLLQGVSSGKTILTYLVFSGVLVIAFVAWLAVKGGRRA